MWAEAMVIVLEVFSAFVYEMGKLICITKIQKRKKVVFRYKTGEHWYVAESYPRREVGDPEHMSVDAGASNLKQHHSHIVVRKSEAK